MPLDNSLNIRWRYIPKEKLSANLYSSMEVRFARELPVGFPNDYVRGNPFGKIVYDESGENFLADVLHFFA